MSARLAAICVRSSTRSAGVNVPAPATRANAPGGGPMAVPGGGEVLEPGAQALELSLEHHGVSRRTGVPPHPLAGERQRGRGAAQLVLRTPNQPEPAMKRPQRDEPDDETGHHGRQARGAHRAHTASVSL